MNDFLNNTPPVYYLCASGEAKRQANAYRRTFLRLHDALRKIAKDLGAQTMDVSECMRLRSLGFKGNPPPGWTKPDKHGHSRPLKRRANAAILQHFTPEIYRVMPHADLQPFFTWLACPTSYEYTTGNGWGSHSIGRLSKPIGLAWLGRTGPILLWTPDVAAARRAAAKRPGEKVKGNALNWKPPAGLRRIPLEQWKLLEAKHNLRALKSKKAQGAP